MAVTGHPLTAQVAGRVLERGGNAVDAGVAAGLAANVVQVDMCNLGGIAPILVRPARSRDVMCVAGVGRWSSSATLDAYTRRFGQDMQPGCAPSVVPAALGAWLSALDAFGTWSFADVAAPAIELASEGFVLDSTVATALDLFAWVYEKWPSSAEIFCPSGRRLAAGDRLVQEDLGKLLARLASVGSKAGTPATDAVRSEFYEGDVAEAMVDFVSSQGGFLTMEDLAEFRAEISPAPARGFVGFGDLTVYVTPPAWSQGPALLQALAILEKFDLSSLGHNSAEYLHLVLEATKLAFSDRERFYGEDAGDLEWLFADAHASELASLIDPSSVLDDLVTMRHPADDTLSTTHIAVVDADGTAFSCAPSDTLAMSPIVPGLGVLVSGRGVQSRTDPRHPAVLGPRRRPRVTPSPAIVLDGRGGCWPIACPGGDVILQATLQVFLNVTVFGMTEQQAVEAPRAVSFAFPDSFHPHAHPLGAVAIEGRVPRRVMEDLAELGHDVRLWPDYEFEAGSVGMIRSGDPVPRGRRNVLRAAADPRRAAYAVGR